MNTSSLRQDETIDVAQIRADLTGCDLCKKLDVFPVLDSTNDYLLQQMEPIHGHVVVAEAQTQGKGRRGKYWNSPVGGGIYLSLGWQLDTPYPNSAQLSLLTGLSVVKALAQHFPTRVQLKWPNDIVYRLRKLGGVLLEIRSNKENRTLVSGIGINTNRVRPLQESIDENWTNLSAIGEPPAKNRLIAELVRQVYQTMAACQHSSNILALIEEWRSYDAYLGRQATLISGDEKITGTVVGVNDEGGVLLSVGQETYAYHSGSLSLR